jgi:uncharacterized protein involved in exopolysaccharide biosynthesis
MVRHARAAAIFAVVGVLIALAVAMLKPRRYRSETVILYREGVRWSYLGASDLMDPGRRVGQRLREIVLSRAVLTKVMHDFKLYAAIDEGEGTNEAIEQFRRDVTFKTGESDTISIAYEASTPETAQGVAAALAEELTSASQRLRSEQAAMTSGFLDAEARRSEETLRTKETEFARFLAEHPEFALEAQQPAGGGGGGARRAPGAPGPVGPEKPTGLVALEREAARIRSRLAPPTPGSAAATPPPAAPVVPVDPKLAAEKQAADAEVAEARRQLGAKEALYTPQHPDVRAAQARVKAAEGRAAQADSAIRASRAVESDAPAAAGPVTPTTNAADRKALEGRLAGIEAAIARAKSLTKTDDMGPQDDTTKAIVALETDWQRLSREVAEAREHHKQIQDKTFLAGVAASSATQGSAGQMLVVDPAYKPLRPVGAGRGKVLATGVALVIPLALALALVLALLDDRIYRKADLDRLAVAPVLGAVPKAKVARG